MILKLRSDTFMCVIIFTCYDGTGRILIDPMYYARSHYTVYAGKLPPAVIHEGIYECATVMSRCGMDDHAFWLIDDYDISIFIKDIKRTFFREEAGRSFLNGGHLQAVAGF